MLRYITEAATERSSVLVEAHHLSTYHIPGAFIPKTAIRDHKPMKDFRPISLTFVSVKNLERVLAIHVRTLMETSLLFNAQRACFNGKFAETTADM